MLKIKVDIYDCTGRWCSRRQIHKNVEDLESKLKNEHFSMKNLKFLACQEYILAYNHSKEGKKYVFIVCNLKDSNFPILSTSEIHEKNAYASISSIKFDRQSKLFFFVDKMQNCLFYIDPSEVSLKVKKIFDCQKHGIKVAISKMGIKTNYEGSSEYFLFFEEKKKMVALAYDWNK